jgi:maleylacetate reductase
MLPYVLDFNAPVNAPRQFEVSAAMGRPEKHASEVLDDFIRGLGMPRRLREVKVEEADLPRLAQHCMLDDWTYSNPRPISRFEEVLEILRTAY